MSQYFSLQNFRIFDNEAAVFDLKPITLLTGCNSSGKSSLVKALMLLSDFFQQMADDFQKTGDFHFYKYKLDFTKRNHQTLGNFSKVLNHKAGRNKAITMAYRCNSLLLAEEVHVKLSFRALDKDELQNGWLSELSIQNMRGETIFMANMDEDLILRPRFFNVGLLKKNFIDFAVCSCAYSTIDFIQTAGILGDSQEADYELVKNQLKEIEKTIQYLEIPEENRKLFRKWFRNGHYGDYKNNFVSKFDWEHIQKTAMFNTPFVMPIFDLLKHVEKQNVRKEIDRLISTGSPIHNGLRIRINKVIEDFESSQFESFIDYFLAKEKVGLSFSFDNPFATPALLDSIDKNIQIAYHFQDSEDPADMELQDVNDDGLQPISEEEIKQMSKKFVEQEIDFRTLYSTLFALTLHLDDSFFYEQYVDYDSQYRHPSYKVLQKYCAALMKEVFSPDFLRNVKFVGSSRVSVQRLYSFDERTSDFNALLLRYFEAKKNYKNEGGYTPDTFMNKWIKQFEIGDSIRLRSASEGLGIMIYLSKEESTKSGQLLADEGYGITQLLSLLLQIETSILESKCTYVVDDSEPYRGSPGLKLNSEKFLRYERATLAIEEPEIHLHPKLQSLLADMFLEAYEQFNIHFIVETHSEYLIRKSQVLVARCGYNSNPETEQRTPFAAYYLPKIGKPYSLEYRKDGKFVHKFGSGFYDEAATLTFQIL